MHTSMSHLIGTTALLAMMSLLIAAIFQMGASQTIDISKRQLQEITDYTSSNFYNLILTAVNFSTPNTVIWKRLDIPTSVGGKGYSTALSNSEGSLSISALVDTEPYISAVSTLPVNNINAKIMIDANDSEDLGNVIVKSKLFSGESHPVIWVKASVDSVVIGLGVMKG